MPKVVDVDRGVASTKESIPGRVEKIRKHFWAKKVDVPADEVKGRGAVDGVWFAEREEDLEMKEEGCVVLFAHGGAYIAGDAPEFWKAYVEWIKRANKIAKKTRLMVFSLEYSLAPKHTYPVALNEAISAYRWLTDELGYKNVFVGGDSAGGNLTLALLTSPFLKHHPHPPLGAVLLSPWADLENTQAPTPYLSNLAATYDYIRPHDVPRAAKTFIGPNAEIALHDPRVSFLKIHDIVVPKRGVLVDYSGKEVLAPSIEVMIEELRGYGEREGKEHVRVVTQRAEDMPHDFTMVFLALFGFECRGRRVAEEHVDGIVRYLVEG
ncbi:hypothetical protein HK104_007948, partial [Borealophlyctis nickersoniae]